MTEIAIPPAHRVGAAISGARAALGSVAGERPWSMTAVETEQALDGIAALEAQTAELKARVVTHAETIGLPAEMGARSVAALLARRHRLTRQQAHRQQRLATGLDAHPVTAAAMSQAKLQEEQALAIIAGVDALPDDLAADLKIKAEEHLIELAGDYDARALTGFARTILEVVAPEIADAHLAKQLEKLERDAEEANRFRVWETPQGRFRGDFDLDGFSGACLKKALFAHAAPKHRAAKGPLGDRLPTAERLGEAFAEYVCRYSAGRLPQAGGLNATVVVLMSYETLMGDLRAAKLDTGEHISAGLARRIACNAGIIPAVLGGKSEVLDLGRAKRFHSRAQRILATIEQGGCLEEGCDAPPAMTHMHHPKPWSKGGETNRDAWMLCPSAHRRAHDPTYTHEKLPNGKVRFHRRT
jgi:hypothetical protein